MRIHGADRGYSRSMTSFPLRVDSVVLDVDGTLVDSNYHHTLSWWRAFHEQGREVPAWRIHRAIGMGGDRLVAAVAGDRVEEELGDAVRDGWERHYDDLLGDILPLPAAGELIADLDDRGLRIALASSGIPRHTDHAVEVLQAGGRLDTATTSEDADQSKPHPELVQVALDQVDASHAVLVGDSVWDVRSAKHAGLPVIAVLCGGFARAELEEEGADVVCEDLEALRARLDELVVRR
jgi:phosphoglycolate phosphatase-like HAD superfamily hydrolase